MPCTLSRSHSPSCHTPSRLRRGVTSRSLSSPPRQTDNATASPVKAAARCRNSSPLWMVSPLRAVITSPGQIPASRAGQTEPSSVSTSAKPETTTPRQRSEMPTASPTGTSISPAARTGTAVSEATSAASSAVVFIVFVFIPCFLSDGFARHGSMAVRAEFNRAKICPALPLSVRRRFSIHSGSFGGV